MEAPMDTTDPHEMHARPDILHAIGSNACPRCEAKPGYPCRSWWGLRMPHYHAARIHLVISTKERVPHG
jgi:hypothetical protein